MKGPVAIIAGSGALPAMLAAELAAEGRNRLVCALEGFEPDRVEPDLRFRVERLAPFLRLLIERGVTEVVFAGAARRPRLDPSLFDPETAALLPRLLPAMHEGDDKLLRAVMELFEDTGMCVVGAADLAPELVPSAGVLGRHGPGEVDRRDAARAAMILAALGPMDVGQGAVVAQGLCLGIETLPGTDALLSCVAGIGPEVRPDPAKGRGLLYKAPKPGQDRRIDLPTLGPATVERAVAAGLGGIAFEAGGVLLLDRAEMIAAADRTGVFLWARQP